MTKEQYIKILTTHQKLPVLIYGPISIWLIIQGISASIELWLAALCILGGLFFWSFLEYVIHRFQFHLVIHKQPWNLLVSELHHLHHEKPDDPRLITAPILFGVPVLVLVILLCWWMSSHNVAVTAFTVTGLIWGYLVYEWVHSCTHRANVTTTWGRYLKRHHMKHHFTDETNYFGVTSPFWDIVFRTLPSKGHRVRKRRSVAEQQSSSFMN